MPILRLKSLVCDEAQGIKDDLYLKAQVDSRESQVIWGARNVRDGAVARLGKALRFQDSVQVELWEHDRNQDDLFGSVEIRDDQRGERCVTLRHIPNPFIPGSSAAMYQYDLYYEVLGEANDRQFTLTLHTLKCNDPAERKDNPYLLVNGRKIWGPKGMKKGQREGIGRHCTFRNKATVELFDYDRVGSPDSRGSQQIDMSRRQPGRFNLVFKKTRGRKAKYTLDCEVG